MRKRTVQLNIRLTQAEHDLLTRNSRRAGLPTSGYLRMLLHGCQPKETPPEAYYETMNALMDFYKDLEREQDRQTLQAIILAFQRQVTQPEHI